MKISIIVPIYNAEKYLEKCISSILHQDYENFELILVNDGSTDQSEYIIDKFAKEDSRVKVFHKINGGVSSARNFGISQASGEYICFVDSDDWLSNKYLSAFVSAKSRFNTDDETLIIQDFNLILSKPQYNTLDINEDILLNIKNNAKELSEHKAFRDAFPFNKFYSSYKIKKNNILFNEKQSFGEDFTFFVDYIVHIQDILLIKDSNYNYLIRENSLTSTQRTIDNEILVFNSYIKALHFFQYSKGTLYNKANYILESGIIRRFYNNNENYPKAYRLSILSKISEIMEYYQYHPTSNFLVKKIEYFFLKQGWIRIFDWYKMMKK